MKEYTQLQYALSYARLGFSIFPIKPKSKIPLEKNGLKNATKDEKKIREWWGNYPDCNIGIATGKVSNNLIVFDFEMDENSGLDGKHSFSDYCKTNGIKFPDTVKVSTGRSGEHWYYKTANGKNMESMENIVDGVNLRGNNGYIIAAGSTHANGNKYKFIQDFNAIQVANADNNVYNFIEQKKNDLKKKEPRQYITLKTRETKSGDSVLIQSIENCCTVLLQDKNLAGKIRYNELSYSPFIHGDLPWTDGDNYREWNNFDDSNLKCYIEDTYGLTSMEKIMEALNIVAFENKFNPVKEYLGQLEWDGKERIKNLLPDYLGVEQNEYSQTAMKLFMLGAINRAYYPGCKFDYMPVLVGEQGVGKSTFFKILAGNDAWYNDNFNTVEGDKAAEKLRGMWIVELAELLATKRAKEVESIKAFITSTVDSYRPPYGRRTEQRPRSCVFAGTTNNSHFMTDKTGNRRYLPLVVRKKYVKKSMFENREEVQEDFKQAWAEALHIFKTENPRLVFPKHLEDMVLENQKQFAEEDVRVGLIQEYLDELSDSCDRVCVMQLWDCALGNEGRPCERRFSNDIHDIMQHSIKGWQRVKNEHGGRCKLRKYGTQICYERIEKKVTSDDEFVKLSKNEQQEIEQVFT